MMTFLTKQAAGNAKLHELVTKSAAMPHPARQIT